MGCRRVVCGLGVEGGCFWYFLMCFLEVFVEEVGVVL